MIIARPTFNDESTTSTSASPLQSLTVLHPNPSQVLVQISTSLLIQDFHKYYKHQPIDSFSPVYYALPDASLVTPPLLQDLNDVHIMLIWTGALCAFFIMNIITIIRYIRWGKVKNKTLFYLLLGSQIAGPLAYIPFIVGVFDQSSNCYIIIHASSIFTFTSFTLLVTGIFGIKAYRCLNNSRFVLAILFLLRSAAFAAFLLDRHSLKVARRLAGPCVKASSEIWIIAQFIEQLVELLFISSCFLYALLKSQKLPLVRGRVTISVRTESEASSERRVSNERERRGWWDYVPAESSISGHKSGISNAASKSGIFSRIRDAWGNLLATPDTGVNSQRKPSLHTDYPIPQPLRYTPQPHPHQRQPQNDEYIHVSRPHPRRYASQGLLVRYLSPFQLISGVLRNELAFTAMVTIIQTIVSITALVGAYSDVLLGAYGWSMVNWILLSLTTLYSLRRVVKRHNREAFLQQPATWDRAQRAQRSGVDIYDHIQQTRSPTSCNHSLRRSSSVSSSQPSQHLFGGYNLNPIRGRYCCSSCTPSDHADNLGLPVCWKQSCTSIAPSFVDTQSIGDVPSSSIESVAHDGQGGSDTLHPFVKRQGWEPPGIP